MDFFSQLEQSKRIIPVITLPSADAALPLADVLADSGFKILEITMRTSCALEAIKILRQQRPDLCVGAGTIKDKRQLAQAQAAGSQFIVSPGISEAMITEALANQMDIIPGVMTPSEILLALTLGLTTVKLFPANIAGGPAFIKGMGAVFPEMSFFPTGGITEDTINDYLDLNNVLCAGGTWLTPVPLIEAKNWSKIHEIAQRC